MDRCSRGTNQTPVLHDSRTESLIALERSHLGVGFASSNLTRWIRRYSPTVKTAWGDVEPLKIRPSESIRNTQAGIHDPKKGVYIFHALLLVALSIDITGQTKCMANAPDTRSAAWGSPYDIVHIVFYIARYAICRPVAHIITEAHSMHSDFQLIHSFS